MLCARQMAAACAQVGSGRAQAATVRDWDGLLVRQTRFSRMDNERAEGECRPCAEGKYQAVASATGSKTCLDCPPHTRSPLGAYSLLACICQAGYTGTHGGPCEPCAAGQYKSAAGSADCSACPPGTYSQGGYSACVACAAGKYESASASTACSSMCPGNTTSVPGSSSLAHCICDVGYTGDSTCTDCKQGKYKDTIGSASCQPCLAGTFSLSAASHCTSCLASKYSGVGDTECRECPPGTASPLQSISLEACTCRPGYGDRQPATGACSACEPGSFKILQGNGACVACELGKTSEKPMS
jgi:hypothetical protein